MCLLSTTRKEPGRALSLLADIAYILFFIVTFPYVAYQMLATGKYRRGFWQRLGFVPPRLTSKKCLWIHGVSVGEILAARTLVASFEERHPDWEVVLSTITDTGFEVAVKHFPNNHIFFMPVDISFVARKVIRAIDPACVVLLELEIWPNFIREVRLHGSKVLILNGRLSDYSFKLHQAFWRWLEPTYGRISHFAVQSDLYARRLSLLGVPCEKVEVTGNMKYDTVATVLETSPEEVRRELGIAPDDMVFVAGSTHPGEEEIVLTAYEEVKSKIAPVRLILAPRRPERREEVGEMISDHLFPYVRRSKMGPERKATRDEVILVDTMGELARLYAASDVVFVGGSLVPHGGQNMLEPAALGKAVLFGPHTENFSESVELLLSSRCAFLVKSPGELSMALYYLLREEPLRKEMGRGAWRAVLSAQGATDRNLHVLEMILEI